MNIKSVSKSSSSRGMQNLHVADHININFFTSCFTENKLPNYTSQEIPVQPSLIKYKNSPI